MAAVLWILLLSTAATASVAKEKISLLESVLNNRPLGLITCQKHEYLYNGLCCSECPAGTHVAEHCSTNMGQGKCEECIYGENYTLHPNGLEYCLSCKRCREDEDLIDACTKKTDTVCQCKNGTYCINGENCEVCKRCLICGPGQRIKQKCNATSNTVCEDEHLTVITTITKTPSHAHVIKRSQPARIVCLSTSFMTVALIALFYWKRRHICKRKAQYANGNSTSNGHCEVVINERDNFIITDKNFYDFSYCLINEIPNAKWRQLIRRLHLTEAEIDNIEASHTEELKYQMLLHWRRKFGRKATIDKIFNALDDMTLRGCKENIITYLKESHHFTS